MEVKNYFATDTQGNVLGSAQVYLYLAGTTTLATGLQTINGAALGNPFTSEANGLVQFKAPDNNYDLRVVKPGREFTIRIQCFDGIAFKQYVGEISSDLEFNIDETSKIKNSHERLIFKKKKILSLPMRNPEWDWLSSVKGIRFYPQTFCLDEYSGKILLIDGTSATKAVLVYDWPTGVFDRVFMANGGLVSEGAVIKMEGASKYLYLRTSGDRLAKYDITSYPEPRSSISESVILPQVCGLNFMERNGYWTISDIASGPLGNLRSRGKFIRTDSQFNTLGGIDCGDYLMGIYAGRSGDTSVTKTQGVTDTGYGLVAQMGGQWVSSDPVTPYSQNGLRVFTYDGDLVAEGLLQVDKFSEIIQREWGFTPQLIESEGIVTAKNGDVFSLTVTSNNGASTASSTHGMLIMQEFSFDGVDFSEAACPRLQRFQSRCNPVSIDGGTSIIDPTNPGVPVTNLSQVLIAMQRAGLEYWTALTTGLSITDISGNTYPSGCQLKVALIRSDLAFTFVSGYGVDLKKRVYLNSSTGLWVEDPSYFNDGVNSFSASGLTITRSSGGPTLNLDGANATLRQIIGKSSGSNRIRVSLGDSTPESGGDSGSNFAIATYADSGAYKATPLQVSRASGETQLLSLSISGPSRVGQYLLSSLPSAAAYNGYEIDVTNASGGPKRCRSNGSVWQILNTTTTVS